MTQAALSKSVILRKFPQWEQPAWRCLPSRREIGLISREAHTTHDQQLPVLFLAQLPSCTLGLLCIFQLADSLKFPFESQTTEASESSYSKVQRLCPFKL